VLSLMVTAFLRIVQFSEQYLFRNTSLNLSLFHFSLFAIQCNLSLISTLEKKSKADMIKLVAFELTHFNSIHISITLIRLLIWNEILFPKKCYSLLWRSFYEKEKMCAQYYYLWNLISITRNLSLNINNVLIISFNLSEIHQM
jgi:hypothetical protein